MSTTLSVLVADGNASNRRQLVEMLDQRGHRIAAECSRGEQLLELCSTCQPDLVIADIDLDDGAGDAAAQVIFDREQAPVIGTAEQWNPTTLARGNAAHMLGFLTRPFRVDALVPAIELARGQWTHFHLLRQETAALRQALADRKVIERAKGILMSQANVDEPEAFRRLRRAARNAQAKLADVAQMIVMSAETLRPERDSDRATS